MAGEVPTDFWNDTRAKLDKIKPVFMLAEADKSELTQKAFHADYNWPLLSTMNDIAKGKKTAVDIDKVMAHHDSVYSSTSFKMNFVTNHDENSWNGTEYERMGEGANTFVILTYTYPGMPLIYTGQEVGLKKRLSFFEKDTVPNWKNPAVFSFYKKLNELKHSQPALAVGKEAGKFIRYVTTSPSVYVFERKVKRNSVLVVLNLSVKNQVIKFMQNKPHGVYTDYFLSMNTDVARLEGGKLMPWQYAVYISGQK